MINKKKKTLELIFLFGIIIGIFAISSLNFVNSVGETSYCAERTTEGAWCQNVPLEKVDDTYRSAPTNCESTSFCKLGTCVNSQEGLCMENTPQRVCEEPISGGEGVWYDAEVDEVPQCSLGCCILGDQAAFVTQPRCKQLSSEYGLETNYKTDIQSEVACIASVSSSVKGACVFEKEFERTCKFTTKAECDELATSDETEFHEGFLCSAENLATNCGPSEKTTILDGQDEIYFLDTCGNPANIYDASRINDNEYWSEIVSKAESCGYENLNGNAGSSTCGNCDYFLGSTGKKYERGTDNVAPRYGDYICRDLSCEYEGQTYQHGETWCSVPSEDGENLPGDRYNRLVCYDNEVSVEPCADFRQEVCIQDEVNGFSTAACRVNKWQDCVSQSSQKSCENQDRRDCQWLEDTCVPKYAPGYNFWEANNDAESLCLVANEECIVRFEEGLFGEAECVENCDCLGEEWIEQKNQMCIALGDCGSSVNFVGTEGYNSLSDLVTITDEEENSKENKESGGGFFG